MFSHNRTLVVTANCITCPILADFSQFFFSFLILTGWKWNAQYYVYRKNSFNDPVSEWSIVRTKSCLLSLLNQITMLIFRFNEWMEFSALMRVRVYVCVRETIIYEKCSVTLQRYFDSNCLYVFIIGRIKDGVVRARHEKNKERLAILRPFSFADASNIFLRNRTVLLN